MAPDRKHRILCGQLSLSTPPDSPASSAAYSYHIQSFRELLQKTGAALAKSLHESKTLRYFCRISYAQGHRPAKEKQGVAPVGWKTRLVPSAQKQEESHTKEMQFSKSFFYLPFPANDSSGEVFHVQVCSGAFPTSKRGKFTSAAERSSLCDTVTVYFSSSARIFSPFALALSKLPTM